MLLLHAMYVDIGSERPNSHCATLDGVSFNLLSLSAELASEDRSEPSLEAVALLTRLAAPYFASFRAVRRRRLIVMLGLPVIHRYAYKYTRNKQYYKCKAYHAAPHAQAVQNLSLYCVNDVVCVSFDWLVQ